MEKSEWIRAFWVKMLVFIIAIALVLAFLLFGAAGILTNGQDDFLDSDIFHAAVNRQENLVWQHYGRIPDAEFAQIYPKNDPDSNYRFTIQDTDGKILYNNRTTAADRYVTSLDDGNIRIDSYVRLDLQPGDDIYAVWEIFRDVHALSRYAIPVCASCLVAFLLILVYLACVSGKRPGLAEPVAGWQEKIPFDLYLCGDFALGALILYTMVEFIFYHADWSNLTIFFLPAALLVSAVAALFLALWMTFCARVKLGAWWKNTIIYMVLCLVWKLLKQLWQWTKVVFRALGSTVHALPLVWRTALATAGILLLLFCCAAGEVFGLYWVVGVLVFLAACAAAIQLRILQKGGEALANGDLDYKIDTNRMFWDFKRHGENLNAIGDGMGIAVEERLRSERLKTELITNVSHDIKTPLTSIINYVDLLQKTDDPEARADYLAVLARQANKLKKLTVDLVEMSKASTGAIPCSPVDSSVRELVEQALGEYIDRLDAAGLEAVLTFPEGGLRCMADGALLWRVMDNLFSNACKYAMPGTRLYIDAAPTANGRVKLSFKNISREKLNVSAEELMERFVRGDSSRSTEGSGLGLNIAQSLVELQGGSFALCIDGDLFKAEITLPGVK